MPKQKKPITSPLIESSTGSTITTKLRTSPINISSNKPGLKRSSTSSNLLKIGWNKKKETNKKSTFKRIKGVTNINELFKSSSSSKFKPVRKKEKERDLRKQVLKIRAPTINMRHKLDEIIGNNILKSKLYNLPDKVPFLLQLQISKRFDNLYKNVPAVFQSNIKKMYVLCRFKNSKNQIHYDYWGNRQTLQRDIIVDWFIILQNGIVRKESNKELKIMNNSKFIRNNKLVFFDNKVAIMYIQNNNIHLKNVNYIDIENDNNANIYNEIMVYISNIRGGKKKKTRKNKRRRRKSRRKKSKKDRKRF